MRPWQERLAALEVEFVRQLPEYPEFAATVADYLKGAARREPEHPEAAFQAALERLVELVEAGPPRS